MSVSTEFDRSYSSFINYPTQLIHKATYTSALEKCRIQLGKEAARGLCIRQDSDTDIVFRDLDPTFSEPERRNVFNDIELQAWLEFQVGLDTSAQQPAAPVVTLQKADPKCRFIYLYAGDSRKSLLLTRTSLARIMTYHQVMPMYLDFLYCFGSQEKPRDIGFSGFREQTLISDPPRGPVIPALKRSGRYFQMCYNLKAPYWNRKKALWSIRPIAIHHQFDIIEGTTLWIVTKGNLEMTDRIKSMTDSDGRPEDRSFGTPADCFKSSLSVHLLVANWSTEDWRARIRALEEDIEQSFEAVDASQDPGRYRQKYKPDHLFWLQGRSDKTQEAIMVMETNVDVLVATKQYYERLLNNKDFPLKSNCSDSVASFGSQIDEMIYDMKTQISRAKLLARITADRKDMISRRLDSQATESMERLTTSMYNIGVLSQTEAAAMRVITVVTMLYLPATFVSTFFSTDVVHYQQNSGGSSSSSSNTNTDTTLNSDQSSISTIFSTVAMERWLEVTLPLTLVTILIAWYLYAQSKKRIEKITGISGALPLYHKPMWTEEKV